MTLVSSATQGGNLQSIWPRDVLFVEDLPADLAIAIDQAQTVCRWRENLEEEYMPPRWMWHLDWELEAWFIEVKNKRNAKYGNTSSDEDEVPADWEENEYAARFK